MRRVTEIAEIKGIENGGMVLNRTHRWDPVKDELERVETPSLVLAQISEFGGISPKEVQKELQRREEVLKLTVAARMGGGEVYRTVQNYYTDPEGTLGALRAPAPAPAKSI